MAGEAAGDDETRAGRRRGARDRQGGQGRGRDRLVARVDLVDDVAAVIEVAERDVGPVVALRDVLAAERHLADLDGRGEDLPAGEESVVEPLGRGAVDPVDPDADVDDLGGIAGERVPEVRRRLRHTRQIGGHRRAPVVATDQAVIAGHALDVERRAVQRGRQVGLEIGHVVARDIGRHRSGRRWHSDRVVSVAAALGVVGRRASTATVVQPAVAAIRAMMASACQKLPPPRDGGAGRRAGTTGPALTRRDWAPRSRTTPPDLGRGRPSAHPARHS